MHVSLEMVGRRSVMLSEKVWKRDICQLWFSARADVRKPQMSPVSQQQVKATGSPINTASAWNNIVYLKLLVLLL